MSKGSKTPAIVHWIVVRLSALLKPEDIAIYTGISLRSVERILHFFKLHGTINHKEEERKRRRQHLRNMDIEFLLGAVRDTPDLYLDELQDMLATSCGRTISRSTVWRVLNRAGFTLKKITKVAAERSAEKRLAYLDRISRYSPRQLIFVDESSVDRRTTYRGRAWSIRGSRAQRKAFFVRGKRFSVLPAISLDNGILHCDIIEGSFCTDTFTEFIRVLLNNMQPYPAPNSVIVMDNCRIHKHPDIIHMIEGRGMRCEFLPPYSPDFNPIELAFSAMKHNLRRNGDYVRMAMTELGNDDIKYCLLRALYSISLDDIYGWYHHCSYV